MKKTDGKILKKIREEEYFMSQAKFAEYIGVCPASVSSYENGGNIQLSKLKDIVELLKIDGHYDKYFGDNRQA